MRIEIWNWLEGRVPFLDYSVPTLKKVTKIPFIQLGMENVNLPRKDPIRQFHLVVILIYTR